MRVTRREFIGGLAATGALANAGLGGTLPAKIDRYALVSRHNPVIRSFDPLSPLSVGNGEFAFTCDITGLQTFPDLYKDAMPLCTMSQWGWHTKPMPDHLNGKELKLTDYDTYGRRVGYQTSKTGQEELFDWLRENPHRLHLGQIGLKLLKSDGTEAKASDISNIEQTLDLRQGFISSKFTFDGMPVWVSTACHPARDSIAVNVSSDLVFQKRLSIKFAFPYGSQTMQAADWAQPQRHTSVLTHTAKDSATIARRLDNDEYAVSISWEEYSSKQDYASLAATEEHTFLLSSVNERRRVIGIDKEIGNALECVINFTKGKVVEKAPSENIFHLSSDHWKSFWEEGAVVDFTGSTDKRAPELERRVVLSQYLTAIQCSGSLPPQETGLTTNSWYGKFHLEMHWWHAAHFALWNRFPLLGKSLDWYEQVLPSAKERARQQGYDGARWAKMTAEDGRDSPSPIGPLLIWQQPHPIFYAELAYLNNPSKATLIKYQTIVEATAAFMASYAHFEKDKNRYILGPPVIPAQENHPARETWNPTFELEYWHFGLKTAQKWRERLGLNCDAKWDDIIQKLSKLPEKDGVYLAHENCPQTYTQRNKDHPSMIGALGILSGELVDRKTMQRTLKKVMKEWDWPETWGWDYPMVAMTAARLGEGATAIDALLLDTPKNKYLPNGHNYQRPNLPLYLPGNGGLLYAIALMANGWKNSPKKKAPGFPSDGSWTVRTEGFNKTIFNNI